MNEPSTQVRAISARMVKVENIGNKDYNEEFRGEMWSIPANGHIIKPVASARKFVSQFKKPMQMVNGRWEHVPGPKPLRLVELTPQERKEIEGVSEEDVKKAEKKYNKTMSLTCMKCGFVAASQQGLKVHRNAIHPEDTLDDDT